MLTARDTSYYQIRAATERRLADAAQDPAVQASHRKMARMYDELLAGTLQPSDSRLVETL